MQPSTIAKRLHPVGLSTPQARVLRALDPISIRANLPVLTRIELAEHAGFSETSGTINRVLHGIRKGSSSGKPHMGLLDLGLVRAVDLDGVRGYQITTDGLTRIKAHPELPELRDKSICINNRYLEDEDMEEIEQQEDIDSTTKKALVDARLGQGTFRLQVLQSWDNCCSVTGSATQTAIRASHIKPWRESSNIERLDPNNGLPLIASLDALFDAGLVSFNSHGRLLVSSRLTRTERDIFGIIGQSLRKKPTGKMAGYLASHRAKHGFR